jgi:hypothetical protein
MGVALELDHLLQRPAHNFPVGSEQGLQVLDRNVSQADDAPWGIRVLLLSHASPPA